MVARATNALETVLVDPHYVQGGRPDEIWAHFRAGAVVPGGRDRLRHYPGLAGAAPATLGLYLRADELRISAHHVIDAGCGAGEGLRHLCAAFRRVTGVDRDPKALAFARQLAPQARLTQAELGSGALRMDSGQLVFLVDVLGQVDHPERVLHHLSQRLDGVRGLVVAEVKAAADQCLIAPVRRAFSPRGLNSLLARGGFCVECWLDVESPFVMAHAVAHRDAASSALLDAETRFGRGDLAGAEELAVRACNTTVPVLRLEALLALAHIQIEMSRRDAATATLLEASAIDVGDARAPAALSRLAQLAGSESNAFALAKEAVQLDLTEVAAVAAHAFLCQESDPRTALDFWLVAHALAPSHLGIAASLCETALKIGDLAVAITVLERLRRYGPMTGSIPSSVTMAWMLARAERPMQAELQARLSEIVEPNSADVRELLEFLKMFG